MHFHWLRCRDAQDQFRYYTDSCQRSRIQETLRDTRYVITSDQCQIWRDNTNNTNKNVNRHKFVRQNSLPDTQVPEHDSSKKCLRILWQGCVRPTSMYGAIRIAHSLVQSKSHQKQACEQNCTLAGAIKIAPRVLNLQVCTYLMTGKIPAKATKHLKSLLVTRYLIGNKKREARR